MRQSRGMLHRCAEGSQAMAAPGNIGPPALPPARQLPSLA